MENQLVCFIFHRLKGSFNDVSFLCYGIWQRVRGVLICGRDRPKIIRNFQAVSATDFNIVCHCPSGCRFIRGLTCISFHRSLLVSDDEEDTKRVVRSAKDKRFVQFFFIVIILFSISACRESRILIWFHSWPLGLKNWPTSLKPSGMQWRSVTWLSVWRNLSSCVELFSKART